MRVLSISVSGLSATVAFVADTTLKQLNSSANVRARVAGNMNQDGCYSDTLHLYRLMSGSYTLENSKRYGFLPVDSSVY